MKKQLCVLAVGLALMGCSDDESVNQALLDFGVIEGYIGNLHINQKVAATDGEGHVFPGHANQWNIDAGQACLADGGDDQFDGAFNLSIDGTSYDTTADHDYTEFRFLTPEFGQAQGFVGASTRSDRAVLAAGRNNQLLLPLDLRNATGTVTLNWDDQTFPSVLTANGATLPANEPLDYSVVIFDSNGNETVLFQTTTVNGNTNHNADLTDFRGAQVVLGFRVRNSSHSGNVQAPGEVAAFDNVSVLDGAATQFVANGNFTGGSLNGWIDGSFPSSTNIVANNREINGVTIQRFFFADPNRLWGRQMDTFTNNGAAPVTFDIGYESDLGSDGFGIIYAVPNTNNQALASFDGSTGGGSTTARDRDLGLVIGPTKQFLTFQSASATNTNDGNPLITWRYDDVTLQPGQTIVMAHFAILTGNDTGTTGGVNANTQIPDVNDICQRIVSGQEPDAFQVGIPLGLRQLGFFNWQ